MIINEPKKKGFFVTKIREFYEHRALWLYLLTDEAKKKGWDPEQFAPAAIKRCGCFKGGNAVKAAGKSRETATMRDLQKQCFPGIGQKIFEMKFLRCDDDAFDVDFHYCPLVASWKKQNCTDAEMDRLCQWAMEGDRAIAEEFGAEFDLQKTIARGEGVCALRFRKKKG
jgi:hypothetical protein